MRNIVDCVCPGMTTPMNTMGMGDVSPLNGDPIMPGSGDEIEQPKKKKKIKKRKKTVKDYIYEGKIEGLDNVNIIRHYTTGKNLESILNDGEIKPSESTGDKDWIDKYDIKDMNVISFHDERTDPEYDTVIKSNNEKRSLITTQTLGIHDKKICACIEVKYDTLEDSIKANSSILQNYKEDAERFVRLFNSTIYIHNYFPKIQEEMANEIKSNINDYKDELNKNVYGDDKVQIDEFPKYYKLFCKIAKKYILDFDYYKKFAGELFLHMGYIYDENSLDDIAKETPVDFKEFSQNEAETLANYCYTFQLGKVAKFLYDKGINVFNLKLNSKDIENKLKLNIKELKFIIKRYGSDTKEIYKKFAWFDMNLVMQLISYIYSRKKYGKKEANKSKALELRIPSTIKLTKDNAIIKIFTGMCEGTKQSKVIKFAKKYKDKYTFKLIEPNENS